MQGKEGQQWAPVAEGKEEGGNLIHKLFWLHGLPKMSLPDTVWNTSHIYLVASLVIE